MEIQSNSDYSNQVFASNVQIGGTFENIEFTKCIFSLCDFSDSKFTNCVFEGCKFQSTNISNCKFENCRLQESKFEKSKLIGIDWTSFATQVGLKLSCENSDLSFGVFIGIDISESMFIGCKMQEMDFSEATAKKVIFTKSDLFKTIFYKTNLREADFVRAVNYIFDPSNNYCKGAKFLRDDAINLLLPFGIEIVEEDIN